MHIIHISAECYPLAKVGGLADVVGALPKYQNQLGHKSMVIMPLYNLKFTNNNKFEPVFEGQIQLSFHKYTFQVVKLTSVDLGFDVFCIHLPSLLYRNEVYTSDDSYRFLAFQVAALDWIKQLTTLPDVVHCHDHHSGFIPFMMSHCNVYETLRNIPSILTIHNGQYQGWADSDLIQYIPYFHFSNINLLLWGNAVNALASSIKCSWKITTVSPSYMHELMYKANGLEDLLKLVHHKCQGILNGIDTSVWNPKTDHYLKKNYSIKTVVSGKKANKAFLCEQFNLDATKPLFVFIGRLVGEKAADLLPYICDSALQVSDVTILILGSGSGDVEHQLNALTQKYSGRYNAYIGYDEQLSHIMYAGADFLLMPSRVEPCGLNQMYALRYGTVPVVSRVGGLIDTVADFSLKDGFGITYNDVTVGDVVHAIYRGAEWFSEEKKFKQNTKKIMSIDHSWDSSAQAYVDVYNSLKN